MEVNESVLAKIVDITFIYQQKGKYFTLLGITISAEHN
jgi:hypothetical protein